MSERNVLVLIAAYTNSNALYFPVNILAKWLGFRIASRIFETSGSTANVRLLATKYCLYVACFMYSGLSASLAMINVFSWVFSELLKTRGISSISQEIVDFDAIIPTIMNGLFVFSIIAFQLIGIWKTSSEWKLVVRIDWNDESYVDCLIFWTWRQITVTSCVWVMAAKKKGP